jgi:hypothetical protein
VTDKPTTITAALTARQRQLISNPARIVFCGTGTKTGKTMALGVWMLQGMLAGESCAWIGPWFARSRSAYETIKSLLAPFIATGEVTCTDGILRIRAAGGGGIDFYSGDAGGESLFGGNYSRVVLDEASRMPEKVFAAALTIISATGGKIRLAFNVELGSKNWAIRNLLRVQAMSPEQRRASSEDYMTFPTGGEGLVAPELIEAFKSAMPAPLWRALYLAEIPESDTSLFRNLDKIFTGQELDGPAEGAHYACGIDLGRKQDYSVITVIDVKTKAVVACDRFHEISWTVQTQRCASLYKKFHCNKAVVDATGIGDPITEELVKLGLKVDPFIFTQSSRKSLLEALIVACDNSVIALPASQKFAVYRQELESFEYQLDGSTIRYSAPEHMHDDSVMSLALALHASKHSVLLLAVATLVNWCMDKYGHPLWQEHYAEYKAEIEPASDPLATAATETPLALPANSNRCPVCGGYLNPRYGKLLCGGKCGSEFQETPLGRGGDPRREPPRPDLSRTNADGSPRNPRLLHRLR